MHTFFGNISSVILGLCLGLLTPIGLLYPLSVLLNWIGFVQVDSLIESIVVSGRPEYMAFRTALIGLLIFCAAFMIANLALKHKREVALAVCTPLVFIGYGCIFGYRPETDRWIDSFLFLLWTQPFGLQALFIITSICVILLFGYAAWSGAQKGMQTTNFFTKQPASQSILIDPKAYIGSVRIGHSLHATNATTTVESRRGST